MAACAAPAGAETPAWAGGFDRASSDAGCAPTSDDDAAVLARLLASRGYDARGFHPSTLRVVRFRILRRLLVLGRGRDLGGQNRFDETLDEKRGLRAYAELCAAGGGGGDEARELDGMLRITYTQWNRNHIFDFLAATLFKSVAECARDRGDAVVRAWCAGCSTGQEPYALAAYWARWAAAEHRGAGQREIAVLATDLDGDALDVARAGAYRLAVASPGDNAAILESYADLPPDLRKTMFDEAPGADGAPTATVKAGLRRSVAFAPLDLREPPPVANRDHLIICRHSGFMYLDGAGRKGLLKAFHRSLCPGGFLVVGHDERLPGDGAPHFEARFPDWGVYARSGGGDDRADDSDDSDGEDGAASVAPEATDAFADLYADSAALNKLRREQQALARQSAAVLGSRGLGTSLKDLKRRNVDVRHLIADLRAKRLLVDKSILEKEARLADHQRKAAKLPAPAPKPPMNTRKKALPPRHGPNLKKARSRATLTLRGGAAAARSPARKPRRSRTPADFEQGGKT